MLCIAGCFPFLLCILLGACLPSTDFDVNAYHFLGPKEFYQSGRISFLPHNVYTSFPFLTEMLTLQAMVHGDWLWGAVAGKVLLAAYAPLTALAIFAAGRRWFGPIAGVIGAIVYLGTPWTFRISTIAYVEGALSFYLFAALWGTVEAVAALRSEQPAAARSWFLLAGLLSGSAMACKYPGLVSVIIPLGAAAVGSPFLFDRTITPLTDRCRAAAMFGAVFLAGVLLTVGPWLLKNAAETGNPVYPLAYSVFGGRDWDAELDAKWRRAHSAHSFTWNDAIGGLADVSLRNDWLSPLLFGLAPLSLGLLFRPGPQVLVGQVSNLSALSDDDISGRTRALLIAVWLYLLYLIATWWGLTHRIDRFFVPQHPIVALLAGAGVAACLRHTPSRPFVGAALAGVIGTASLFNLGVILSGLAGYNEFLSDLKYADAKARRITAPEIVYLNSHLPKDSKVLCVGDAELFYAEYPVVYNTVFDRSTFEECFGDDPAAISKSEIIRRLKHHGITHVYVNWLEVLRYRTTYGYTDAVMPARFTELQSLKALGPAWSIPEARTLARDPKGRWQLNSAWEQEVQTWGPELLRPIDGQQALVTFQVFPVLQE